MSRKIKLIWDFRGPGAEETAKHHNIHLKEFLEIEQYVLKITGFEVLNDMYSIAYLVVNEEDMIRFRDLLKPHRGTVYSLES